eukprot:768272-Hanusia_phi.AAC.7
MSSFAVIDVEFLKRPYRLLQPSTHKEMLMTMHNLVQGIKKSAKIARTETTAVVYQDFPAR